MNFLTILKDLKDLRNLLAMINIGLWRVLMEAYSNFGYDPDPHVTETTIGNLVWHIFVLILTPIAILINVCAMIIKIICKTAAIKLA